jgi:uncharacterized protein DUF1998
MDLCFPPATEGGQDVPAIRFPEKYYCSSCRKLADHRFFAPPQGEKCNQCDAQIVPSRFVICCPRGHIDDFPYFAWVHAGEPATGTSHELKLNTLGASAALRDIIIECKCGNKKSLEGAFAKNALAQVTKCKGRRPWIGDAEKDCGEIPRTLQRGASNVWFPQVLSSISIPPWSDGAFSLLSKFWFTLQHIRDEDLSSVISGMKLTAGSPYMLDDLVQVAIQRKRGDQLEDDVDSLKKQEYRALVAGQEERDRLQEFVCTPVNEIGDRISGWFARVMQVKKLREVRALQSFTRLFPSGQGKPLVTVAALSASAVDWLPAIEVVGEGVFLQLNPERLLRWEQKPSVKNQATRIKDQAMRIDSKRIMVDENVARFILIHTLAHSIISQWALDCGYPAASLRERLYVGKEMAGILTYTATSDSAGSLGGLIAQANTQRLESSLCEALLRASWCSGDPLCIEAGLQGTDSLNLAACHACVLLPEVSCEELNVFLDRGLLVGTPDQPDLGFFRELLENA